MKFELSMQEAQLLDAHLVREIEHVENELVHTDKRWMQSELAREVEALKKLRERLSAEIGRARVGG